MYVSKSCVVYCFIIVDVSAFHWNLIKSIFLRRKKNHNRNWIVFCIWNVTFLLWYRFNDTLRIPVKPLLVNITNKRAHLSALRTYEIECTSSGSRPEAVITWWKGNHQVKHMARNVSITFLNLRLPCFISTIFTRQIHAILDSEFFVVCR